MTPDQYEILKQVHETTIRIEERYDSVERKQKEHSQSIIEVAREHLKLEKKVDADRNKVKGVLWFGGTGLFATIIGWIVTYFKN